MKITLQRISKVYSNGRHSKGRWESINYEPKAGEIREVIDFNSEDFERIYKDRVKSVIADIEDRASKLRSGWVDRDF